ncbi:MAG: 2-oxo acid dehydrogenase subunit E2, partial [Geminicoccaceae bacterium]
MSVEIRVPTLGESVTEATIAKWLKQAGDAVAADEPLVELETDKVSLEVPAPSAGVLSEILVEVGSDVSVGAVIGRIEAGAGAAAKPAAAKAEAKEQAAAEGSGPPGAAGEPARAMEQAEHTAKGDGAVQAGPAARKLAEEKGLDLAAIPASGPKGNVTKGDVVTALADKALAAAETPLPETTPAARPAPAPEPAARPAGREERVRMTRLRKRIAERLKEAQNTAAMLTTFNEVDMTATIEMRARYQDQFTKKHGIKLGFMGFFVKAAVEALKAYPAVNSEIDGDEVVYKHHYDIGEAVSTDQGRV